MDPRIAPKAPKPRITRIGARTVLMADWSNSVKLLSSIFSKPMNAD